MVLEFTGVTADQYDAVNGVLGLEASTTGMGDWPPGLVHHFGGLDGDDFIVVEEWESRAQNEDFWHSRLGPALGQVGVPEPTKMKWYPVIGAKA